MEILDSVSVLKRDNGSIFTNTNWLFRKWKDHEFTRHDNRIGNQRLYVCINELKSILEKNNIDYTKMW